MLPQHSAGVKISNAALKTSFIFARGIIAWLRIIFCENVACCICVAAALWHAASSRLHIFLGKRGTARKYYQASLAYLCIAHRGIRKPHISLRRCHHRTSAAQLSARNSTSSHNSAYAPIVWRSRIVSSSRIIAQLASRHGGASTETTTSARSALFALARRAHARRKRHTRATPRTRSIRAKGADSGGAVALFYHRMAQRTHALTRDDIAAQSRQHGARGARKRRRRHHLASAGERLHALSTLSLRGTPRIKPWRNASGAFTGARAAASLSA